MTKKAAAVKSAPRKAKAVKPTVAQVEAMISQTIETFGKPGEVESAGAAAAQTLSKSEAGVRQWHTVALASLDSGQSGVAFGKAVGGNNNSRTRLIRAASILAAAKSARKPVPFWEVVADGNAHNGQRAAHVIAELKAGRNPYDVKAASGNAPTAPARRASVTKSTLPKSSQWATLVRAMATALPKDEDLSPEEIADLDRAVRALAVVTAKRAAGVATVAATATASKRTPKASKAA